MAGYVQSAAEVIHLLPQLVLVSQLIGILLAAHGGDIHILQQTQEAQLMKHVELSQDEIKQLIAEKYGVNGHIILNSRNVEYKKKDYPKSKYKTEVYASFWVEEDE